MPQFHHPTFVKGSGRNPAFLRMRDFVDSLVLTTEATLARDASAAPLAKGAAKLPEQRALRRHLGLPKGATQVARARLRAREFGALVESAGVELPPAQLAELVALIGGPLPEVPALVRSAKQPVPYLEAERLCLSMLPQRALQQMLQADPPQPRAPGPPHAAPPPLPEWHEAYLAAANAAAASADANAVGEQLLPAEARPRAGASEAELQRWWAGATAIG